MNITVITVDDDANVLVIETIPPLNPAPLPARWSDCIYIRHDWPHIGDEHFAERLRAWHAEHNQET